MPLSIFSSINSGAIKKFNTYKAPTPTFAYAIPTTVSQNGLPLLYYPFWENILDFSSNTLPGKSDATAYANTSYTTALSYNPIAAGSLYNSSYNSPCGVLLPLCNGKFTTALSFTFWFYLNTTSTGMIWNIKTADRMYIWCDSTNVTFNQIAGVNFASYTNCRNKWMFCAAVIYSTGTNNSKIYSNVSSSGQIVDPTTNPSNPAAFTYSSYSSYPFNSSNNITYHQLFSDNYGGTSSSGGVVGYLNNFYLFNRALTTTEISALYNQTPTSYTSIYGDWTPSTSINTISGVTTAISVTYPVIYNFNLSSKGITTLLNKTITFDCYMPTWFCFIFGGNFTTTTGTVSNNGVSILMANDIYFPGCGPFTNIASPIPPLQGSYAWYAPWPSGPPSNTWFSNKIRISSSGVINYYMNGYNYIVNMNVSQYLIGTTIGFMRSSNVNPMYFSNLNVYDGLV